MARIVVSVCFLFTGRNRNQERVTVLCFLNIYIGDFAACLYDRMLLRHYQT